VDHPKSLGQSDCGTNRGGGGVNRGQSERDKVTMGQSDRGQSDWDKVSGNRLATALLLTDVLNPIFNTPNGYLMLHYYKYLCCKCNCKKY
jgi:hypothetical protein